ncbi:hypothetical protein MY3296_009751 [Beauveria thailandica]
MPQSQYAGMVPRHAMAVNCEKSSVQVNIRNAINVQSRIRPASIRHRRFKACSKLKPPAGNHREAPDVFLQIRGRSATYRSRISYYRPGTMKMSIRPNSPRPPPLYS